jgi:hypothetical protein
VWESVRLLGFNSPARNLLTPTSLILSDPENLVYPDLDIASSDPENLVYPALDIDECVFSENNR